MQIAAAGNEPAGSAG